VGVRWDFAGLDEEIGPDALFRHGGAAATVKCERELLRPRHEKALKADLNLSEAPESLAKS
jgi:hypothetical protein